MFIPRTGFICIDEMQAQDIDTEEGWSIAEAKYDILHSKRRV